MPRRLTALLLALALAACTDFPDLDAAISDDARTAPYPHIAPLDTLGTEAKTTDPETATTALEAQAASLRTRAATLRTTPIE